MRFLFIITAIFIALNSNAQSIMKVIVHTPTNKLENSVNFYQKLGFKVLSKENPVLYTDGKALIEINPDRKARAGLKLYKKVWSAEITKLEAVTKVFKTKEGYLLYDPSGIAIYLVESDFNVALTPADSSFSHLGNYQGLTVESADITKAFNLYEILGFKISMGDAAKGFVGMESPDNFTITLLAPLNCPHLFFNPSLTYFNGKNNTAVIKKIRELNIPITEEITGFSKDGSVDNIIIRDPGGYGFFLFND